MTVTGLRYGEHGIGVAAKIAVRVAKGKGYETRHNFRVLPLISMFYTELEMHNDISKIQYREYACFGP